MLLLEKYLKKNNMIFLAGPHGSGKTKTAEIINRFGFFSIDLGPTLRKICFEQNDINLETWIKQGETRFGTNFTDKLLIEEIIRTKELLEVDKKHKDIVIVGSRSRVGIENIICAISNVENNKNHIIFLDAPFDILRERYNSREKSELDSSEFSMLLERDLNIGLNSIRDITDIIIWNDGNLDSLEAKIKEVLFQKFCYATEF